MSVKISIITICFNNPEAVIETCNSVDEQTSAPFEHWIIDGSTNDSIKQHFENTAQPVYRKYLNERDKGIADAFNKGVLKSGGDIVNMLNSGDCYYRNTVLDIVQKEFEKDNGLKWLHGKYLFFRGGQWVVLGKPFEADKLYRGMRSLCHQTMFVKRELHDKYGVYDTSLTIAMDYDFVCRIAFENVVFLNETLVKMEPAGISSSAYFNSLKQGKMVYEKHFGRSFKLQLWQLRLKLLHVLLKSPAGNMLYKIKTWLKLENA